MKRGGAQQRWYPVFFVIVLRERRAVRALKYNTAESGCRCCGNLNRSAQSYSLVAGTDGDWYCLNCPYALGLSDHNLGSTDPEFRSRTPAWFNQRW